MVVWISAFAGKKGRLGLGDASVWKYYRGGSENE